MAGTIIWDWNGTLLDDVDICIGVINTLLERRGLTGIDKIRYRNIFRFPVEDYYRDAGFDLEKESFADLAEEYMELYYKALPRCRLTDGCEMILSKFTQAGYSMHILSATKKEDLVSQVKSTGIIRYFDGLAGAENIYAVGKHDIALRWAGEHRDNIGDACFIGDTLHDYEASLLIGCSCILLSSGHHSREKLSSCGVPVADSMLEIGRSFGII